MKKLNRRPYFKWASEVNRDEAEVGCRRKQLDYCWHKWLKDDFVQDTCIINPLSYLLILICYIISFNLIFTLTPCSHLESQISLIMHVFGLWKPEYVGHPHRKMFRLTGLKPPSCCVPWYLTGKNIVCTVKGPGVDMYSQSKSQEWKESMKL